MTLIALAAREAREVSECGYLVAQISRFGSIASGIGDIGVRG